MLYLEIHHPAVSQYLCMAPIDEPGVASPNFSVFQGKLNLAVKPSLPIAIGAGLQLYAQTLRQSLQFSMP